MKKEHDLPTVFAVLRAKATADAHLGSGYYSHADVLALLDIAAAARLVLVAALASSCDSVPDSVLGRLEAALRAAGRSESTS